MIESLTAAVSCVDSAQIIIEYICKKMIIHIDCLDDICRDCHPGCPDNLITVSIGEGRFPQPICFPAFNITE